MGAALAEMLSSPLVVQGALGMLVLEAVALAVAALRGRAPAALCGVLLGLAPGACLLVAVLLALSPRPWPGVLVALAIALPLHLADLAWRWYTPRRLPPATRRAPHEAQHE